MATDDLPREPPRQGWTGGVVRALRVNPPRSVPVVTEDVLRGRRAAAAALERYPGPVGATLAAALLEYAEQGWQGAPHGVSERLVAELLDGRG